MFRGYIWVLSLSLLALSAGPSAEPLRLDSTGGDRLLIELYTSEGCSSCPPAERLLNRIAELQEVWSVYVPVAFHVDYWNYLGWSDRFSQAAYSQRQRGYVHAGNLSSLYTPGLLVNGHEWRGGDLPSPKLSGAALGLELEGRRLRVTYGAEDGPYRLYLALLGMGLETDISAGENQGSHARHDFVVLGFVTADSADGNWQLSLPDPEVSGAAGYGLAAWVGAGDDPTPLQVVGGALPERLLSAAGLAME